MKIEQWKVGQRVSRLVYMDDGTWDKLGDRCLQNSPSKFGTVIERDSYRLDACWVRWDNTTELKQYLDHGLRWAI